MATVKEGQTWAAGFAKETAKQFGFDVRTYWRQPQNGVDWKLEVSSDDADASVQIPIWFLDLKRVEQQASRTKIQEHIREGLASLRRQIEAAS